MKIKLGELGKVSFGCWKLGKLVKARFEKTKKIQLPGYAVWAPNMTEQENLSNDELRKCVNRNGYVMPEKSYQYQ